MPESIPDNELPEALKKCSEALLDKKAVDLKILDVRGHSSITDFYLIASGQSSPQLKAMAESAKQELKQSASAFGSFDGDPSSGWVVLDAFEFILHLFMEDVRENYAIEDLWKDMPSLTMEQ